MKRFYLLNIAAILGVLSISLTVSASEVPSSEGFSWVILSDEEPEENSDDDRDKTTDSDSDKGTDTDNDDHNDNDNTKDNESDRNDNDSDNRDDDNSNKSIYPSETIYSKEEIEDMIADKYEELDEAYEIEDKFKKTKTIDGIDSFILNFCGDPLQDKKIAFLGDSITAGSGGTLTPDGSGLGYTDFIAKYTSAKIINLGIGGAPFDGSNNDDALVNRYKDIPKDTDIIVLFGGINDLFAGAEHFGSPDELKEGTYCGDLYKTFQQIDKRHPDAEVYIVITYPNKMEQYQQYTDDKWQDYADVQIQLAHKFDFRIINLYEEGFLDSNDSKVRNAFFKDDIHPDDLGSEILGRHILVHLIRKHL